MNRIRLFYFLFAIASLGFWVEVHLHGQNKKGAQTQFDRWDKNRDGKLEKDELPQPLQRNFGRVDKNGDGFISRKEDSDFRQRMRRGNASPGNRFPTGTQVHKDLPYIKNGHERQKLDLYVVEKKGDHAELRPLVIWIHGGAWRAGSKDRCPATFLLEHGFAVASINYRLSQHAKFPAQITDCKAAIVWLRSHAKDYGLDPDRFGVWGSSAGGHLSALVGTSADVEEFEPGEKKKNQSRVHAVCDWFGPTDFLKMNEHAGDKGVMDHDAPQSPESQLIGGAIQENKKLARKVNPIEYLSQDDPPFLIMHGDRDFLVPIQQSQLLHEAMKKKGLQSKLIVIKGKGHGGFDQNTVRPQILKFFQDHLVAAKQNQSSNQAK